MKDGFGISDNLLRINPKIYCDQYIKAFSAGGKIWKYDKLFTASELEGAKQRIIDKFVKK